MKSMTLITVLLTALTASPLAWTGERINHNEIFALRDAGQILSMEDILNRASQLQAGQFLEAELEYEQGHYVYELKILDTDGTLHKLYMDAADGTLIERKTQH